MCDNNHKTIYEHIDFFMKSYLNRKTWKFFLDCETVYNIQRRVHSALDSQRNNMLEFDVKMENSRKMVWKHTFCVFKLRMTGTRDSKSNLCICLCHSVKPLIMHVWLIQNTSNDFQIVLSNGNHSGPSTQNIVAHGFSFVQWFSKEREKHPSVSIECHSFT